VFEWIVGFVESGGYLPIALLMLAENLFPPIPSELIMPLAGFAAARGELGLASAVLAGSAGSLLGALFWYGVGRRIGAERLRLWAERHGRWLTLSPADVDRARRWFRLRGGLAVLIGRLIPAVRTLISAPAGIAAMPLGRFLALSALGTILWTGLLAGAGYLLGENHQAAAGWLAPFTDAVLAVAAAVYVYRFVTFRA
jgi:membrane protein DedA with SNARE-associated domain